MIPQLGVENVRSHVLEWASGYDHDNDLICEIGQLARGVAVPHGWIEIEGPSPARRLVARVGLRHILAGRP